MTGIAIIHALSGMANVPVHIHIMTSIGYVMTDIFAYIYFAPFKALNRQVDAEDWPTASVTLNRLRSLLGLNLTLCILNIVLVYVLPMVV